MAEPMVALADTEKDHKKCFTVSIVPEEGLVFVSPRGNIVHCAGILDAKRTSHKPRISGKGDKVKH
jgi:hypothetical protein